VSTLNEQLARASTHHQVRCIEGPSNLWAVECQVCIEQRRSHFNWGGKKTWPAPFGEEQATRIALDHLSKLGFVPQRLAVPGTNKGRNRYE
jgi:hypothetical protein